MPLARPVIERLARVLQLDDSPESIARGVALGLFVAFTPTVGIQMVIVLVVNTIFRANRLAGLAMVWLTNPVTVVPVYWWNYLVGVSLLGQRAIDFERFAALFDLHAHGLFDQFLEFVRNLGALGFDVALPLVVGGCVTGAVLGIVAYPLVLVAVRKEREALAHLHALRRRRRARWREREQAAMAAAARPAATELAGERDVSRSDDRLGEPDALQPPPAMPRLPRRGRLETE